MIESPIKRKVCDYAKQNDIEYYQMVNICIGFPDTMFISLRNGIIFFIEFKRKNGTLSKAQKIIIDKYIKAGIKVFVVRDITTGKDIINRILQLDNKAA